MKLPLEYGPIRIRNSDVNWAVAKASLQLEHLSTSLIVTDPRRVALMIAE